MRQKPSTQSAVSASDRLPKGEPLPAPFGSVLPPFLLALLAGFVVALLVGFAPALFVADFPFPFLLLLAFADALAAEVLEPFVSLLEAAPLALLIFVD